MTQDNQFTNYQFTITNVMVQIYFEISERMAVFIIH